MLTRQHFELVARVLRAQLSTPEQENMRPHEAVVVRNIVSDLAGAFAAEFTRDNPRFNAPKFYRACGLES